MRKRRPTTPNELRRQFNGWAATGSPLAKEVQHHLTALLTEDDPSTIDRHLKLLTDRCDRSDPAALGTLIWLYGFAAVKDPVASRVMCRFVQLTRTDPLARSTLNSLAGRDLSRMARGFRQRLGPGLAPADVVQEAAMAFSHALDRMTPNDHPLAYLFCAVRRHLCRVSRRGHSRPAPCAESDSPEAPDESGHGNPWAAICATDLLRQLDLQLRQFPRRHQQIFLDRVLGSMTEARVAQKYGCAPSTVRKIVRCVRAHLKSALQRPAA